MKVLNFIFYFWFCLNFAIIITNELGVLPFEQPALLPSNWWTVNFSLDVFAAIMSGNVAIGIIGLIFKQYVFASLAMVVWTALTIFLPIFSNWLLILPGFLQNLLPPELSSLYYLFISVNTVMFFMFIVQLLTQRSVET